MHFLETISGLRGEDLSSAVLKYLFIHSDVFRRSFVELIDGTLPPSLVPRFTNGINCYTEQATTALLDSANDGSGNSTETKQEIARGRIDLTIRADNVLLGIENKFWAVVQENQPNKYFDALKREASSLLHDDNAFHVYVVAPKQRQNELTEEIRRQDINSRCNFIAWEKLDSKCLNSVAESDSDANRVVAKFLQEYLQQQLQGGTLNFAREKIVGAAARIGNTYHYDLLYRFKESGIFPHVGRISPGKEHLGFYFRLPRDESGDEKSLGAAHWFGFVRAQKAEETVMLIQPADTVALPDQLDSKLETVCIDNDPWRDDRKVLRLDLPERVGSMDDWSARLKDSLDVVRNNTHWLSDERVAE